MSRYNLWHRQIFLTNTNRMATSTSGPGTIQELSERMRMSGQRVDSLIESLGSLKQRLRQKALKSKSLQMASELAWDNAQINPDPLQEPWEGADVLLSNLLNERDGLIQGLEEDNMMIQGTLDLTMSRYRESQKRIEVLERRAEAADGLQVQLDQERKYSETLREKNVHLRERSQELLNILRQVAADDGQESLESETQAMALMEENSALREMLELQNAQLGDFGEEGNGELSAEQ